METNADAAAQVQEPTDNGVRMLYYDSYGRSDNTCISFLSVSQAVLP